MAVLMRADWERRVLVLQSEFVHREALSAKSVFASRELAKEKSSNRSDLTVPEVRAIWEFHARMAVGRAGGCGWSLKQLQPALSEGVDSEVSATLRGSKWRT